MDTIINFFKTDKDTLDIYKFIIVQMLVGGSSLISLIVVFKNDSRNRKNTFINTITTNRIKWMGELKSLINDFIVLTQVNSFSIFHNKEKGEHFNKISNKYNQIIFHLNYKGFLDNKILELIKSIYEQYEIVYQNDYNIEKFVSDGDGSKFTEYIFKHFKADIYKDMMNYINDNDFPGSIDEFNENQNKALMGEFTRNYDKYKDKYIQMMRKINKESVGLIEDYHNELIKVVQIYLKLEWNRVKRESKGKFIEINKLVYEYKVKKMLKNPYYKMLNYNHEKIIDAIKEENNFS